MSVLTKPEITFILCKVAGFGLLFVLWLRDSEMAGFFLLMSLLLLSLLRWRFPKLRATIIIDCALCVFLASMWVYAMYALILVMFEGLYRRFYLVAAAGAFSFYFIGQFEISFALMLTLGAICGLFLGFWEHELKQKLTTRDTQVERYYELETQQSDILTTLSQVERMTAVAERAKIARDIHDNAGHEIVAAYISLQTARGLFVSENADALELYDAAMKRLNNGVTKIRETAHNLQTVTSLGIENLIETCERFPVCTAKFSAYGDTSKVPMYVWNMLEACLNESLTNAAKHANPTYVSVELDANKNLVRLSVENDGGEKTTGSIGSGLKNLRHRAIAIGGTLSVNAGDIFRVICTIPIQEESNESINS